MSQQRQSDPPNLFGWLVRSWFAHRHHSNQFLGSTGGEDELFQYTSTEQYCNVVGSLESSLDQRGGSKPTIQGKLGKQHGIFRSNHAAASWFNSRWPSACLWLLCSQSSSHQIAFLVAVAIFFVNKRNQPLE
ncbi:expressed unknown protein [Seminavis robusta]|uniref:Uncharacterized protein n=1 Tax=Seminavis robusta TaxID=568900 RepID=A0A9N8E598_9STRA|nr:expressed unknown protein [Seminavis robusta]|eukprot:Sro686_g187031.1  (132) ;mRNA; f:10782-11177